jgi:hypothetical protein
VAASCLQFVYRVTASRMQISIDFIRFACELRPRGYKLQATGGHLITMSIFQRLTSSRIQALHELPASCMQSRQFFASTMQEKSFEFNK